MRFIYVDEAEISAHEPYAVVVGVAVHADQQWKLLERCLRDLIPDEIPQSQRAKFYFHATELFSGGRTFDRASWPKEKRWALLESIVSIPRKFNVPISFGFMRKKPGRLESKKLFFLI